MEIACGSVMGVSLLAPTVDITADLHWNSGKWYCFRDEVDFGQSLTAECSWCFLIILSSPLVDRIDLSPSGGLLN